MGDALPQTSLSPVHSYEELLAAESPDVAWPTLDENTAAAMCYTSGTTGNPKGVVYSHRSMFLHSMGLTMACSFGMSESDVFLPVVPMFHVHGLGHALRQRHVGAKQVFPGPHLTPPRPGRADPERARDPHRRRADALAGPAGSCSKRSATICPACAR